MYLDLRDLAKEYEELKERQTEADCDCGPHTDEFRARGTVIGADAHHRVLVKCVIHDETVALDEGETERFKALASLDEQLFCDMEEYARDSSAMIPESEFEDYARDFASEVGYLSSNDEDNNPLMMHIDWDSWAEDMKQDYTEVEFDGDTYLIKAY